VDEVKISFLKKKQYSLFLESPHFGSLEVETFFLFLSLDKNETEVVTISKKFYLADMLGVQGHTFTLSSLPIGLRF